MSSTRDTRSTQQNVTRSASKTSTIARSTVELHVKKSSDGSPVRKRQYQRPRASDRMSSSDRSAETSPARATTNRDETNTNFEMSKAESGPVLPMGSSRESLPVCDQNFTKSNTSIPSELQESTVTDFSKPLESTSVSVNTSTNPETEPGSSSDIPQRTRGRSAGGSRGRRKGSKNRVRELDNLSFSNPGRALSLPQMIKRGIGRPKKEAKALRLHSKVDYFKKPNISVSLASLQSTKTTNTKGQSFTAASQLRAWKEKKAGLKRKLEITSQEEPRVKKKSKKVLINTEALVKVPSNSDANLSILDKTEQFISVSSEKETVSTTATTTVSPYQKKGPGRPKKANSIKQGDMFGKLSPKKQSRLSDHSNVATSTISSSATTESNISAIETMGKTDNDTPVAEANFGPKKKRRKRRTLGSLDKQKKATKIPKQQRSHTFGALHLPVYTSGIISKDGLGDDIPPASNIPENTRLIDAEHEHSYSKPMLHTTDGKPYIQGPIADSEDEKSLDLEIVFKNSMTKTEDNLPETTTVSTAKMRNVSKPLKVRKSAKGQTASDMSRNVFDLDMGSSMSVDSSTTSSEHLDTNEQDSRIKFGHKTKKDSKQPDGAGDISKKSSGIAADQNPDASNTTIVKRPRGRPKSKKKKVPTATLR